MAVCNQELIRQGKSCPRTCAVHGLGPCPKESVSEEIDLLTRYKDAPGQTQREMIVEELRSEDANVIHRILKEAIGQ